MSYPVPERAVPDGEPAFAAQLCEDLQPEDVRRVLGVFAADVVRLSAALRAADADADAAACRRIAHSLAGAAGAVGAAALDQACRAMMDGVETVATPPAATTLAASVAGIDRLCTAAMAELDRFLATMDQRS